MRGVHSIRRAIEFSPTSIPSVTNTNILPQEWILTVGDWPNCAFRFPALHEEAQESIRPLIGEFTLAQGQDVSFWCITAPTAFDVALRLGQGIMQSLNRHDSSADRRPWDQVASDLQAVFVRKPWPDAEAADRLDSLLIGEVRRASLWRLHNQTLLARHLPRRKHRRCRAAGQADYPRAWLTRISANRRG